MTALQQSIFSLFLSFATILPVISSGNNSTPAPLRITNGVSDFSEFAQAEQALNRFFERNGIVGASVAVVKDNRLVYAKGFGYADQKEQEVVQPTHLFRIASISKLVTAIGIMKLVEENKIHPDDKVFGKGGILNDPAFLGYNDKRYERITVHHLLNHTAGWYTREQDPVLNPLGVALRMNVPAPADMNTIIRYSLSKRLSYFPGTTYVYSNLGYAVLGKIIESVSGMPYEQYIQEEILRPLGIYSMQIGRSLKEDKLESEVSYYEPKGLSPVRSTYGTGQMVPRAYGGNNIETLAAAGGWVASSAELARLIAAVDNHPGIPDILSPETIRWMTDPDLNPKCPIGWRSSKPNGEWWRTGTLTGTIALTVRQSEDLSWVVLMNTSTTRGSRLHYAVYDAMQQALGTVEAWPTADLFSNPSLLQPISPILITSLD